jgi:hypothetical protein
MLVARRRLLAAAVIVPAGAVAGFLIERAVDAAASAASALRPMATGTSATRCARCGSPDHTMLEPGCPLEPRLT